VLDWFRRLTVLVCICGRCPQIRHIKVRHGSHDNTTFGDAGVIPNTELSHGPLGLDQLDRLDRLTDHDTMTLSSYSTVGQGLTKSDPGHDNAHDVLATTKTSQTRC